MENSTSEYISSAVSELRELLAKEAFGSLKETEWRPGQKNITFARTRRPWMVEQVDVIFTQRVSEGADAWMEIVLRARLKGKDDVNVDFDGVALAHVVGGEKLRYYVPRPLLFKSQSIRKYAREVSHDLAAGISWFDQFDSVAACLSRLEKGETNLGEIKPQGAARQAWQVLQSWLDDNKAHRERRGEEGQAL